MKKIIGTLIITLLLLTGCGEIKEATKSIDQLTLKVQEITELKSEIKILEEQIILLKAALQEFYE